MSKHEWHHLTVCKKQISVNESCATWSTHPRPYTITTELWGTTAGRWGTGGVNCMNQRTVDGLYTAACSARQTGTERCAQTRFPAYACMGSLLRCRLDFLSVWRILSLEAARPRSIPPIDCWRRGVRGDRESPASITIDGLPSPARLPRRIQEADGAEQRLQLLSC